MQSDISFTSASIHQVCLSQRCINLSSPSIKKKDLAPGTSPFLELLSNVFNEAESLTSEALFHLWEWKEV
jgi:hypothetical protein